MDTPPLNEPAAGAQAENAADAATATTTAPAAQEGSTLVFIVGLALLCALGYFPFQFGYRAGLCNPVCAPHLEGLIAIFVSGIELVLLARLSALWGRPIPGTILCFLFLLLPYGGAWHSAGEGWGESHGLGLQGNDIRMLKGMGAALEAYHAENGAYPPTLQALLASPAYARLKENKNFRYALPDPGAGIPLSAHEKHLPMRYTLGDPDPARPGQDQVWLLWLAGPDGVYDIQDGPELKAALREVAVNPAAFSPWFARRDIQYYYTNKTRGDYVLWKGMGERNIGKYWTLMREEEDARAMEKMKAQQKRGQ